MAELPALEAWATFAKVAECGSFSQAAEELGVDKSTVSKMITRLEERMQTTLFHRTTRKLTLTPSGELALDRALRMLSDAEAIEHDIQEASSAPRGLIRLACSGALGVETIAPILPEFLLRYPEIELDFQVVDTGVNVVSDRFDLGLTIGPLADSSMRVSKLFSMHVPIVGSPAFFDKFGVPTHPRDLSKMPALIYSHIAESQDWRLTHPDHGEVIVHVEGTIRVNNGLAAVPVLVAGLAMTSQPEIYITRELRDGSLITVLGEWMPRPAPVHVLMPPGRWKPARIVALLDFLREKLVRRSTMV